MNTSVSETQQALAQEVVFFPASFAQQRLWFIDQLTPGKATYNLPGALRVRGKLDVGALERALEEVARRHETLRTRFVAAGGELQQVIEDRINVQLPVVDLTSVAGEGKREAEAVRLAQEEARQPFDLQQAPLFRGKLLRLGELDHVLLFTMHHIISDAWSMGVLIEEVSVLYGAFSAGQPSPLPELPIQYADYSVWQRECLEGGLLEGQLAYWKEQLSGVSVLQLPTDQPQSTTQSQNGAMYEFAIEAKVAQQLRKLAEEQGATLFMVLLAAFQTLLYRYSGQDDIAVGTPIAGRRSSDTERLIGFFINTLVLRGDLSGAPSFLELLERTKEVTLGAYAHQDVPFEKLVEVLSPERNLGNTPLFQVMMALENTPQSDLRLGSATLQPFNTLDTGTSKFDLLMELAEDGAGMLHCALQYNTDVFESTTIRRLVGHYSRLLRSIVVVPQVAIHGLEILSREERRLLLEGFNSTATAIAEKTLSELFEEQVERTPNARAIQYEEESLSYIELNQRANQLGHHLRKFGVGPEMRVGICLERSLEMVVSILGVLKAGGTYVPLDPGYPEERLQFMVEDAQVAVLISQRALGERFSQNQTGLIFWEDLSPEIEPCSREKVESGVRVDNAAYMIYTSGSTGRPKGVVVTHGNVARLMSATEGWFEFNAQDVWTMFHSYAFDFSVWELWGALLYGGRLEVIPYWVSRSPELFYRLVNERGVTVLNQTPSAFQQFSREDEERGTEGKALQLRLVIFGGEALEMSSLRPWFERHGDKSPRLVNMYGITETTVHVTYKVLTKEIAQENASVIGTRIPDLQLYILHEMEPVPIGVVGEMYVGGAGLARGYWKRAELTSQRFVPHPFSASGGERLYRTGDLGRFCEDGEIEYLGRIDHQVKIRGFRIELGEIEAALQEHESVRQAVVIARENEGGDKRLVAYVVPEGESEESNNGSGRVELRISELREHLLGKLPEYMVPSAYVPLEKLPLNHNGKIDRKSLPEPDKDIPEQEYVGPRNATEETLCRLWQEVLRRERVGIHDNFFNLGGHSLLAVQVAARMRESFKVEIPLRRMFESPTIAQLADVIDQMVQTSGRDGAPSLLLPAIKTTEGFRKAVMPTSLSDIQQASAQEVVFFPASFAQQRLWFLDQLNPGKATYNIDSALRILGKLNVGALERALEEVARRHKTLRTRFVAESGEPQQVIEDGINVQLPVVDLTSVAGEEKREAEAVRLAQEEARQPFDLKQAPLFRGKLLRLGELNHVLLFTMHHIISDAWSMGILVEEVSVLYGAFSVGRPSPLPELPIQYADYSVWQRECLEGGLLEGQLAYWKEQLSGVSVLQLPTDRPQPTTQSQNGATSDFVMDAKHTQGLKKLAEEQGATLFMVLLAAFQTLLYRYSGQDDIAVGTPIAGRRSSDTERLIGFFINTLVLRGDLSGAPSFLELLERTKEVTLGAYAHQDVPFEKLVEVLSPERNLGNTPLFQVMIVLQNVPDSDLRLGGAVLEPFGTVDNGTSKFDLLLQLGEDGFGKLTCSLQYSTDLFDAATISRMTEHYRRLLSGIADKPTQSIDVLPLLTTNERKQVIVEWNQTGMEYERQKCLPELLEEQARKTPDAIAIISADGQLTYAELNQQANQIGHYLRQLGVGPEERVGICVNRGRDMVAGMVGILKAGGAYVPLDGNHPQERLMYMVEDAKAGVVLTQAVLVERFNGFSGRIVLLDKDRAEIERQSTENLPPNADPENLAYVIYTSGSTGKPKGVALTHRSAVVLLHWAQQVFSAEELSVVLASTSICFDLSVFEIFVPLSCGGAVLVVKDALELATMPEHKAVRLINTVPSAIRELVRLKAIPESVQTVNLAGEALTSGLVQDVYAAKNVARVCNLYGPSEDTTYSTYAFLENDPSAVAVPIGKPIANTQAYVLDKRMEPVPVGVPGELCLGGAGLARGYWGRGDLTAERFVPDGLSGRRGERLYRTGDLVRWFADGDLEYLSRMDHQVKIRGFRIELGEIEAALQEHESVRQAVVIARENEGGDKRLVAYVVPEGESEESNNGSGRVELRISELREHLLGKLPEYMVPSAYVSLEKLPLNHNGKIDRKSLPEPDKDIPEQEYVGPRNATEETLCRLWQEVLRRERVGIHDNFFNLGGHSLLAVQVISRIKQAFAVEMPLAHLFTAPTVARMAELIAAVNEPDRSRSSPVLVKIQPHGSLPPFFCVHAVGGQVISYGELSQELGHEQPFYGLQSPPANLFPASDVSIEQMAAIYIQEIRKVQPVGPYRLGGWSMGGLIAWEMARQMVEEGDAIRLLALMDTTPPSRYLEADDGVDEMSMLARFALDMSRLVGQDPAPLAERFSQSTKQDQWNMVQDALISYGVLTPMTAHAEMTGLLDIFTRNFLAINNYSLHHSQQPVVFFRASETPERFSRLWTRWAGENIQFHSVPGDHFTMLRRPYVSIIAEGLRYCMHKEQHAISA